MSQGTTEDVLHIIFSACDPEGCGEIPVIRLINYIDREMKSCYDRSLLQELKIRLLLPNGKQEVNIQKESFKIIIKDWINYVQEHNVSHSTLQSDDSQFEDYLTAHSFTSDINSVASPESSSFIKRILEERITDLEQHKNNLLDENNKLKVLLKDTEETLQCLTLDHKNLQDNYNVLEKKLKVFQRMKQDYLELETAQQAQELRIRELESQNKSIGKENLNLQKSNSRLQSCVENLEEEKTMAVKTSDNLRKLLSEEKSCAFEMKQKYELAFLKLGTEKVATVEKLKDLENVISDLKNTVGFLKERKIELEDELSKREIKCNEGPETLPMWRFLDESLSDVGETLKLIYGEQECETETNLRAELQASGDICLGHNQLEVELKDYQEKLEVCSSELVECQKNLNTMSSVILRSTELLKMMQNNTEGDLYAFSYEMDIINDQCSSSCKLLTQDLFTELEKVAFLVTNLVKIGPQPSIKEDDQNETVKKEKGTQTVRSDYQNSSSSQSDICRDYILSECLSSGSIRSKSLHEISSCDTFATPDAIFEVLHVSNGEFLNIDLPHVSTGCMPSDMESSHVVNGISPLNVDLFQLATISTTEVDNSVCSIDSSSDLIIQESEALALNYSSFPYYKLPVHKLKFLSKCAVNLVLYGGRIFKILMFLFILWILYAVTGKLIHECYLGNGCGCYDIGEILSSHIKLIHYSRPPV